jgi:DNA processing protein
MASDIAAGVASTGRAVLSGGAYGIDAAAHRQAVSVGAVTIAVMAGGVDRLYPAGNDQLLGAVIENGAVVSEVPPGYAPHRSRFLTRNRLIAAGAATVVVEAALRSGALNTARHAAGLLRPVGAVPGPATSPSSAGCHALIRDGAAVLVAGADHVLELVESASQWSARCDTDETLDLSARDVAGGDGGDRPSSPRERVEQRPDFDTPADRAVYDVTSRRPLAIDAIAQRAGLAWKEATASAGRLEMRGLIERNGPGWRRARSGP